MTIRVLVVDDEASILIMLERFLQVEGVEEIYKATNGQQAIELAMKVRPDLILLDHLMPELTGLDVARRLREETFEGRIIIWSSAGRGARAEAEAEGFEFVDKGDVKGMLGLVSRIVKGAG